MSLKSSPVAQDPIHRTRECHWSWGVAKLRGKRVSRLQLNYTRLGKLDDASTLESLLRQPVRWIHNVAHCEQSPVPFGHWGEKKNIFGQLALKIWCEKGSDYNQMSHNESEHSWIDSSDYTSASFRSSCIWELSVWLHGGRFNTYISLLQPDRKKKKKKSNPSPSYCYQWIFRSTCHYLRCEGGDVNTRDLRHSPLSLCTALLIHF